MLAPASRNQGHQQQETSQQDESRAHVVRARQATRSGLSEETVVLMGRAWWLMSSGGTTGVVGLMSWWQ